MWCGRGEVLHATLVLMSEVSLRLSEALGFIRKKLASPRSAGRDALGHLAVSWGTNRTTENWVRRQRSRFGQWTKAVGAPRLRDAHRKTQRVRSCYSKLASSIMGQILGVKLVSYQMRHSSASIDRAEGRRTLDQIRKRGLVDGSPSSPCWDKRHGTAERELEFSEPCTNSLLRRVSTPSRPCFRLAGDTCPNQFLGHDGNKPSRPSCSEKLWSFRALWAEYIGVEPLFSCTASQ